MASRYQLFSLRTLLYIGITFFIVVVFFWIYSAFFLHKFEPNSAEKKAPATEKYSEKSQQKNNGVKGQGAPASVSARAVSERDLAIIQNGLGTVVAAANVIVHARVAGQLENVYFQEGQLVQKGDVLAEIDARSFRADLAQAEGQAERNRALLANAERDLKRFESLQLQNTISQQQIDAQKSLVAQYKGTVATDAAAVEKAKLLLSFTRITAPISGRIGLRQVDSGNNISPADVNGLAVITSISPIDVVFSLPEESASVIAHKLNEAQQKSTPLAVEAWDKNNKLRIAQGELITLDNQIDSTTGTIKLKARFNNKDQQLFPNQFINVRLQIDTQKQAKVIPSTAIQRGTQGAFVYVVQDDVSDSGAVEKKSAAKTVVVRSVTLGISQNDITAIENGLDTGELIVTKGTDRLRSGAKVAVIEEPNTETPSEKNSHTPDKPAHKNRKANISLNP